MNKIVLGLSIVLMGVLAVPGMAEARLLFFQYGEVMHEVGELPPEAAKKLPSDAMSGVDKAVAAYKCTELSLLWTLMYRDDCTPVVSKGGVVMKSRDPGVNDALKAAVKETYPDGVVTPEGWETYGRYVVGAVFIFFFIMPFFRRRAF
jgi:hypothetical protein